MFVPPSPFSPPGDQAAAGTRPPRHVPHAGLRPTLEAIAARTFGLPVRKVQTRGRGCARAVFARQSAMYLAHIVFALSLSEVGRVFGRERTTVRHACRRVEEKRDDPAIDRMFEQMERACARWRELPGDRERPHA